MNETEIVMHTQNTANCSCTLHPYTRTHTHFYSFFLCLNFMIILCGNFNWNAMFISFQHKFVCTLFLQPGCCFLETIFIISFKESFHAIHICSHHTKWEMNQIHLFNKSMCMLWVLFALAMNVCQCILYFMLNQCVDFVFSDACIGK